MTILFVQSYLYRDTGFYFESLKEFDSGMKRLHAKGIEEVEIQFIDGEGYEAKLFDAAHIHQGSVHEWFEHLNDLSEYTATQIWYLLDLGYSLQEAQDKHEDVLLYFGSVRDYAQELIEDTTPNIPEFLANYIDYYAIARDMQLGGEITEIGHDIYVTNALEF